MPNTKVTIDLRRIDEKEFDPQHPLRIAAIRNGEIIDQKTVTPSKEKDPRRFDVQLSIGQAEDGVAGAEIVAAPADDERNLFSKLTARKFVAGAGEQIDGGSIIVNPGIY